MTGEEGGEWKRISITNLQLQPVVNLIVPVETDIPKLAELRKNIGGDDRIGIKNDISYWKTVEVEASFKNSKGPSSQTAGRYSLMDRECFRVVLPAMGPGGRRSICRRRTPPLGVKKNKNKNNTFRQRIGNAMRIGHTHQRRDRRSHLRKLLTTTRQRHTHRVCGNGEVPRVHHRLHVHVLLVAVSIRILRR